jgi:hypothetical protein
MLDVFHLLTGMPAMIYWELLAIGIAHLLNRSINVGVW